MVAGVLLRRYINSFELVHIERLASQVVGASTILHSLGILKEEELNLLLNWVDRIHTNPCECPIKEAIFRIVNQKEPIIVNEEI